MMQSVETLIERIALKLHGKTQVTMGIRQLILKHRLHV